MDESSARRSVVDATDGVKLSKRFDAAEHDLPTVVYEFTSGRSEAVTVRVVEAIPDALGPDDVGFMGADGTTGWSIKGPKLVFEAELASGGEYTTSCTGRGEDADAVRALVDHPDAFEVDPPASDADTPDVADSGAGAADAGASDDSPEPVSILQDSTGTPAGGDADATPDCDLVVEQFVAELRDEAVSAESREFLRREFGVDGAATGRETDDDAESRLDRVERVERVERSLDDLAEAVSALSTDVERLEEQLPEYDVADRFAELHEDLSEVEEFTETVRSALGTNR